MAGAKRRAEVVWEGNLTQGGGTITSTGTGVLGDLPVTWASRTEEPQGRTSPEELIAAAHAACYAMAFSNVLNKAGNPPERLHVEAIASFEPKEGGGFAIASMELGVRGRVPGMGGSEFERLAGEAEQGCPVSNALRGNVEIRVDAQLE